MNAKDPVWGMIIEREKSAAKEEHEGEWFYFCSESCKKQFLQDPAEYSHD